ncbi:MAG: AAA family ATPase, partial [Acidimicrobiales bacterium]
LVAGWWERGRQLGLTPQDLAHCMGHYRARFEMDEHALVERLASPVDGLCANASIFTRSDVLVALADTAIDTDGHPGPLLVDAVEMERLADAFLASAHVVQLDTGAVAGRLAREDAYTTREILDVQHRIMDRYRADTGASPAVVPSEDIARVLAAHPGLTGEQRHLVTEFCTSGQAVQCAIGRAGAGKTTTMRAAADAWRAAGYDVVGAAVKGEATRHLAAGAGIPAETIAWYLARVDDPPLQARTVLIIDEASTLSDRDLDAVCHLAQRTGATLRLIGDPDQHGAVTAGGMFHHLCHTDPKRTPELATTHRVTDPADREAARLLRAGRTSDALSQLAEAGHLHVADNDIDLYIGMLRNWWDAHQNGALHPMVDRRHHTRHVLNRLARQMRRANNELGDVEITATGDRAFAVGDRIVARMAARRLHVDHDPTAYVRNGAVGTVTAIHPHDDPAQDTMSVCFDDIGEIAIPRTFFDEHTGPGGRRDVGIDHAYAVTSYAVQGATFDVSTSRIDEGASRAEAYVDITRGRKANHLFITRAADPLDGEHLPKAPASPLHDSVADRLRLSGPERAAIEFPPAEHPSAAGRAASSRPPAAWTSRLPEPTGGPCHLRRHWSEALEAVVAYRNRWSPVSGQGAWEWAVGSPLADHVAVAERTPAIDALDRYAVAVAREELAGLNLDDQWAIEHLAAAISYGTPQGDLGRFAHLCQAVSNYRRTAGLDGSDHPSDGTSLAGLIGPEPVDPVMSTEHRRLVREWGAHPTPHRTAEIALT